jgi:hypothetical protein
LGAALDLCLQIGFLGFLVAAALLLRSKLVGVRRGHTPLNKVEALVLEPKVVTGFTRYPLACRGGRERSWGDSGAAISASESRCWICIYKVFSPALAGRGGEESSWGSCCTCRSHGGGLVDAGAASLWSAFAGLCASDKLSWRVILLVDVGDQRSLCVVNDQLVGNPKRKV